MNAFRWWVARKVPAGRFLEALAAAQGLRWVYAERLEDIALLWKAAWLTAEAVPPTAWHHGRAFGLQAEWVWWRRNAGFWVRAVTADGAAPETTLPWEPWGAAAQWASRPPVRYLLAGTLAEPEEAQRDEVPWPVWRTLRLRRNLFYPVESAPEVSPPAQVVLEVRPFVTRLEQPVAVQWRRVLGLKEG